MCETHYHTLYRQVNVLHPYASCGAKPKSRQSAYSRHNPDATAISMYLQERTESCINITETDTICKSCYDMHLVIIKCIKNQVRVPSIQLSYDIELWGKAKEQHSRTELTRSILATVLFVAKVLQHDRSLLLPQAVQFFLQEYHSADETFNEDMYLDLER